MDLNQFPKCKEKLKITMKASLEAIQKTIYENVAKELGGFEDVEIPEITDEQVEQGLTSMLGLNWRQLYDFFDENKIIVLLDGPDDMHGWSWQIREKQTHNDKKAMAISRRECELIAFEEAFKILEGKL